MGKKLTTGERIRRYMEAHPDAKPKQVAQALGVSPAYVHTLRSSDKKKIAEGKPIRRIKLGLSSAKEPNRIISVSQDTPAPTTFTVAKPIPKDNVNHPAHYKVGGMETIDFIEAKKLGYNLGNVVKYVTRSDHKGNAYEDLCKARWYLNREISKYLGVANQ